MDFQESLSHRLRDMHSAIRKTETNFITKPEFHDALKAVKDEVARLKVLQGTMKDALADIKLLKKELQEQTEKYRLLSEAIKNTPPREVIKEIVKPAPGVSPLELEALHKKIRALEDNAPVLEIPEELQKRISKLESGKNNSASNPEDWERIKKRIEALESRKPASKVSLLPARKTDRADADKIAFLEQKVHELSSKIASMQQDSVLAKKEVQKVERKVEKEEEKVLTMKRTTQKEIMKIEGKWSGSTKSVVLSLADMDVLGLQGTMDAEGPVRPNEIDKRFKEHFIEGFMRTMNGPLDKTLKTPSFTITCTGLHMKSQETAKNQYDYIKNEAHDENVITVEDLSSGDEAALLRRATNSISLHGQLVIVQKADLIVRKGSFVFRVGVSFLGDTLSFSDLKSMGQLLAQRV